LASIREVLTNSKFLEALKKIFDYSFETQVSETPDGKLKLQIIGKDTNSEYMSIGDLSAMLQKDRSQIRLWTEARAQKALNPIPFTRIGKTLMFKRSEIIAWIDRKTGETRTSMIPELPFGKKGKPPKVKR
jgi:predicted DNA-binding transcriptional regulator AlpA